MPHIVWPSVTSVGPEHLSWLEENGSGTEWPGMDSRNFDGKSVLITGGTGSLGRALVKRLLDKYQLSRLVVFSRDEQKQYQMALEFPEAVHPCLRYFIGDVRDYERMKRAFKGIDYVIHAAAMKHVHIAEYNPDECVKTNIGGAEHVIRAALESDVSRVVALSTDKACAPVNLYGATKLASDKLFVAANNIKGKRDIRFSVVRYGNVMGSNGSVMPFFLKERHKGVLKITNQEMTRFNISMDEAVDWVLRSLSDCWGGELVVPKLASYRIMDVAAAIAPDCSTDLVGLRPGEKIHEEMIAPADSYSTFDIGDCYVILPQVNRQWDQQKWSEQFGARRVAEGFRYTSGENADWLSVERLRELIRIHIDPEFQVHKGGSLKGV